MVGPYEEHGLHKNDQKDKHGQDQKGKKRKRSQRRWGDTMMQGIRKTETNKYLIRKKIEKDLDRLLPIKAWYIAFHLFIYFSNKLYYRKSETKRT